MIRVAIAEDDPGYRRSLSILLRSSPHFELVGAFPSGDRAVEAARATDEPWDLLVSDVDMPGISGIETCRRMKLARPEIQVVMLTVFEDPNTILEAICAGASGYLTKDTPGHQMLEQLKSVMSGGAPLTPEIASTVLSLVRAPQKRAPAVEVDLTERELQILEALVDGLQYKEVADRLDIRLDTVRWHVRSLYKKLQVQNVAHAVSKALRMGLVA